MAEYKPRIVRGRTELVVPHESGELAFVHPPQGPNNYSTVGKEILARSLNVPTGYQTASLLKGAYDSQEPEFKEVQRIMREGWFWVFNRNLWTPKGVYVAHDGQAIGLSQELAHQELAQNDLEEMLGNGTELNGIRFSQDGNVRFAPRESYRLGEHTPESLASDGFVVASYGNGGAKSLAEVASKFRGKPFTYGIDLKEGEESLTRVSALGSDRDLGGGLCIDGGNYGYGRGGFAFGV